MLSQCSDGVTLKVPLGIAVIVHAKELVCSVEVTLCPDTENLSPFLTMNLICITKL